MRSISACRIALRLARIRFAEVSRFSWNQPLDRDHPQKWVNPRKSNVGGFASPLPSACLGREATELQHVRLVLVQRQSEPGEPHPQILNESVDAVLALEPVTSRRNPATRSRHIQAT
jgi:hypothetical protein